MHIHTNIHTQLAVAELLSHDLSGWLTAKRT